MAGDDKNKNQKPNLISPGDTIIFKRITISEYEQYNKEKFFQSY